MPPVDLSRRSLLRGAAAAGALLVAAEAVPSAAASPFFRHGVASGDPLGTSVILWTRVTPDRSATPGSGKGPAVKVEWEVSRNAAFTSIVRKGSLDTHKGKDHTVKVDVTGLAPYTRYYYRFKTLGATSPVGRTQTASDDGRIHALRLAYVSCSNWTGGYFSSYRYIAKRDDLDAVIFLGDYIYDYGNGSDRYGPPALVGKRDHVPAHEIISLADYRQRHAQYKTDPDLQAAHAAHPWVVTFDDHEVCDNTYATGGYNHQPQEGSFLTRRDAAYKAYLEWMPIRLPDQRVKHHGTRFWRRLSFGPLADLTMLETRQNRDKEVQGFGAAASHANDSTGFLDSSLVVNSPELADPKRQLMEPEQMAWLTEGITSKRAMWHLIGNQTVFARMALLAPVPDSTALAEQGVGTPIFNSDQWDGYQNDQAQVLEAMAKSGGDVVILTGDIHASLANEIPLDPGTYAAVHNSVGVEFVCPSITSDTISEALKGNPQGTLALTGLRTGNTHIKYFDIDHHGFCILDVTPQQIQSDWYFVADRLDPRTTISLGKSYTSQRGTHTVVEATKPMGRRSDLPH